jgi:peptidyl-tRNA hydrolase
MANIQHKVIVRRDLAMPIGLLSAQVAHIGDQWLRSRILNNGGFTDEECSWMKQPYITILAVNCREELEYVIKLAENEGLQVYTWVDTLQLQIFDHKFSNILVGCSIGPDDQDKLDVITGHLPLFGL